jgi:hypothetical protein
MTKTARQKQLAKAKQQQLAKTAGKKPKQKKQGRRRGARPDTLRNNPDDDNMGAAVGLVNRRLGLSDIKKVRISWILGYTFVGSAADGVANSVYFLTADQTNIVGGASYSAGSGWVPIAGSDTKLGATYISDLEKHFARKVIHKQWMHVDSLHPTTQNDMMCAIAAGRGGNLCLPTEANVKATAGLQSNTLTAVSSVKDVLVVESYKSRSMDITHLIAGGSGPAQNEFDIQGYLAGGVTTLLAAGVLVGNTLADLEGLIPSCIAVSGNNSTAALQATTVHQIVIEQEVSLLDFVGGMALGSPVE